MYKEMRWKSGPRAGKQLVDEGEEEVIGRWSHAGEGRVKIATNPVRQ